MAAPKKRSRKNTIDKSPTFVVPTLLRGEDAKALRKLSERITKAVKPADTLEEIWVADVVQLQWDLQRLHESKAQLIRMKYEDGLQEVVNSIFGEMKATILLSNRKFKQDGAEETINAAFEHLDITEQSIVAQTIVLYLDDIERLDRIILSAEVRRNNAIREVQFHRDALARNLRRACEEPEDAEFTEIAPSHSSSARPRIAAHRNRLASRLTSEEAVAQADEEGALADKAEADGEE